MTVSTTTQRIPSITGVMPSRRHPMVPRNTHSVFLCSFRLFRGFPIKTCIQTTHSHWHIRPRHQVQRRNYDGCRQPRFVISLLYHALYCKYLSDLSIIWLSCTLQRRAAPTSRWRLYSRRCEWRFVRLSIPSAYPRRTCYLRGIKFTRWTCAWPR